MKRSRYSDEQIAYVLQPVEGGTPVADVCRQICTAYSASLSRACRLAQISRSLCSYRSRRADQRGLRLRLRELAHALPRFGYRRLHVLLRREGWRINMKRVRRLYRLEGLQLRYRLRRRKHLSLQRGIPPKASRAHER